MFWWSTSQKKQIFDEICGNCALLTNANEQQKICTKISVFECTQCLVNWLLKHWHKWIKYSYFTIILVRTSLFPNSAQNASLATCGPGHSFAPAWLRPSTLVEGIDLQTLLTKPTCVRTVSVNVFVCVYRVQRPLMQSIAKDIFIQTTAAASQNDQLRLTLRGQTPPAQFVWSCFKPFRCASCISLNYKVILSWMQRMADPIFLPTHTDS